MSDLPRASARPVPWVISTAARESVAGHGLLRVASYVATGGAWPSANLAIYVPFEIDESITALIMFLYNGSVQNGNVDLGIYDSEFNRLVSKGSTSNTAGVSANALQVLDITDTVIPAGRNYLAMAMDNTTSTPARGVNATWAMAQYGQLTEASAFPLPATATPIVSATAYTPVFGLSRRTAL